MPGKQARRKKKDGDIKEEYSEDLPPFVIRLMVLGCLFALSFLVVLIAAVVQDSFTPPLNRLQIRKQTAI
jgi:hypothetical protein